MRWQGLDLEVGDTPGSAGEPWRRKHSAATILVLTAAAPVSVHDAYDWSALDRALEGFVPGSVGGLTFVLSKGGRVVHQTALGN